MARYIAFFGSINVGGNRLTMADLRWAFEREGFTGVETVVASGNVLFDFDERPTDGLEELFAHMMAERFDIASFVAVRSGPELAALLAADPFTDGDDARVHALLLSGQPDRAALDRLIADHAPRGAERIAGGARALYIDYVDGVGQSRLSNAFIERRLGLAGTARNRRSLQRILAKLAEATT
ncbi:DUF1697 domain-containing protein [Novosphingobium piscinae]|uniref:DUF1697 domain-containing protein n=1 Tax=Novosphingobium piscinae TaxID=1507448 RepID=A0A7X1FX97_9SPHN|nr:DUF1697 domain-containing protein [Novosphingobium piscinae]MBC2668012.1 DUF1697 domain-containing protein [Novosphingobium piscinae]